MPEKAESILKEILRSLKKEHPNWNEERRNKVAYGAVNRIWVKKYSKPAFN